MSDLAAATTYYRENLRFHIDWVVDDIDLAGVSRDDCRLFLAGPAFRKAPSRGGPVVTWLNLSSKSDVDALHEAWRATHVVVVSPPESKSWGLHEFTAADADGNLFRVFFDFATVEREAAQARAS